MYNVIRALIIVGLFAFSPFSFADEVSESFQKGVDFFQKSQFQEAKIEFNKTIKAPRYRFASLYNLGNISYREKKIGEALGYYHAAQGIRPRDRDLVANLQLATNALKVKSLPNIGSSWESFRQGVLLHLSTDELLAGTFISGIALALGILRYLRAKRDMRLGISNPAKFSVTSVLAATLFLAFGVLSALKIDDNSTIRATVIANKVEVRSGPSETNASIYQLSEGLEVLIEVAHDDWLQVTYPGGLTGWVPKSAVYVTAGRTTW